MSRGVVRNLWSCVVVRAMWPTYLLTRNGHDLQLVDPNPRANHQIGGIERRTLMVSEHVHRKVVPIHILWDPRGRLN